MEEIKKTDLQESHTDAEKPQQKRRISVDKIRRAQEYATAVAPKKRLTIPVRKPGKERFIQTCPDPAFHLTADVICLTDVDNQIYLVNPDLALDLAGEPTLRKCQLTLTVCLPNCDPFLWPIMLPKDAARTVSDYTTTALGIADNEAIGNWVRVITDDGYYSVEPGRSIKKPVWPDMTLEDLLNLAFTGDKFIDDINHPVLKQLRGEDVLS